MLSVITIPAFNDNYIWLFHQADSNKAYVVDPGCAKSVLSYLQGAEAQGNKLDLVGILITHHHADHTGGIAELQKAYQNQLNVYGPSKENIDGLTELIDHEQSLLLPFIANPVNVIEVPGHTLGHIAYSIEDALFCGDTLFSGGCGRLFEGSPEQMSASLSKLSLLDKDTKVYCAHEYTQANLAFAMAVEPNNPQLQQYNQSVLDARMNNISTIPTTIATELAINPFLRSHCTEIKQSISQQFNVNNPTDIQTFTLLRQWKNNF
ncbi:hydroxyacylglutathione hydrolase [Shewanella sp. KT0246]|uniref:hydroxyacylglutathione hydrolase n=1 Tax=Shewanella sp. KT0246 TaxID=2815912 RepID=UPI001BBC858C|nr:hydroxyacylglutathione hydrolase [Shewanella sp. KT0246]GIU52904.1 hydroxyacylglutathione hydrolase [Shewanella sp. KT0246]